MLANHRVLKIRCITPDDAETALLPTSRSSLQRNRVISFTSVRSGHGPGTFAGDLMILGEKIDQHLHLIDGNWYNSAMRTTTPSSVIIPIYYLRPRKLNGKAACDEWWVSLLLKLAVRRCKHGPTRTDFPVLGH